MTSLRTVEHSKPLKISKLESAIGLRRAGLFAVFTSGTWVQIWIRFTSGEIKMAICPRCGEYYNDYPALSRYYDVEICTNCGVDEGVRSFLGAKPKDPQDWFVNPKDE